MITACEFHLFPAGLPLAVLAKQSNAVAKRAGALRQTGADGSGQLSGGLPRRFLGGRFEYVQQLLLQGPVMTCRPLFQGLEQGLRDITHQDVRHGPLLSVCYHIDSTSGSVDRLEADRTVAPRWYNSAMQRTTIVAPEELLQRLRRIAAERSISMAMVIREALEEKVRSHRPRPRSLGIGTSGQTDTARRAGEERAVPRPWR